VRDHCLSQRIQRAFARLRRPGDGPVLEFEQLVKIFFAEHGTKEGLLATIASVQKWVDNRFIESRDIPRGYLDGRGPFPERLPWLLLGGQFLTEFMLAVERWRSGPASLSTDGLTTSPRRNPTCRPSRR
jgi:hypothetical protein